MEKEVSPVTKESMKIRKSTHILTFALLYWGRLRISTCWPSMSTSLSSSDIIPATKKTGNCLPYSFSKCSLFWEYISTLWPNFYTNKRWITSTLLSLLLYQLSTGIAPVSFGIGFANGINNNFIVFSQILSFFMQPRHIPIKRSVIICFIALAEIWCVWRLFSP